MSDYLPSFIVEPVLRQARRFSRYSTTAEDSPGFLPVVPDLQRWSPARFWNTSPPPPALEESIAEPVAENSETTVQSITRTIQLWAAQLNSFDSIPSPLLEPMDDVPEGSDQDPERPTLRQEPSTTEFPPLEPEPAQPSRPVGLENYRNDSETSLNPANELSYQSRVHERPHATSDPQDARNLDSVWAGGGVPNTGDENGGRRRDGSGTLPEDDGMGHVRQKISAIWAGPGTPAEKSRQVHLLMMERYQKGTASKNPLKGLDTSRRAESPLSTMSGTVQNISWSLTEEALQPTYAPLKPDDMEGSGELVEPSLGCMHYIRNVKMQCSACEKWYTCRLCHDEVETHTLPRRETKHMLCMLCKTPQAVGQVCKKCQVAAAHYYCPICKLWNNDPDKSVYHCDDCGICRVGEGLGKDFFHCKTCAACMSIAAESTHKCIERSTKSDCPICGEFMFTSNKAVAFMRCGHSIHEKCFAEWCDTSYKCPICSKSIANMESQFRRLDRHIEEQPMPEEYRDNRAYIFCNDCNSRSVTKYHWLGLKCTICESYNTAQLELLGAEETPQLQEQQQLAQQLGTSEAALTASQSHTPTGEMTQPVDIAGLTQVSPRAAAEAVPTSGTPASRSSWLLPRSPTARSARSMSPVIGSYFGTSQRSSGTPEAPPRRGTTPLEDDDDLDFWGGPSSPRQDDLEQEDSESDSESDHDETMEDDDEDEDDDAMDLIGHR
jgi:uncharacterized CHY-type Zn-finger protein